MTFYNGPRPESMVVLPNPTYKDAQQGSREQAALGPTIIPRADRWGQFRGISIEANMDAPVQIDPGDANSRVTTLRELLGEIRKPNTNQAAPPAPAKPAAPVGEPLRKAANQAIEMTLPEGTLSKLRPGYTSTGQTARPPVAATAVATAQAPTVRVTFADAQGEITAMYHDVLRGSGFIVLIYDTRFAGGAQFFPAVNEQPLMVHIGGTREVYEARRTGVRYTFEDRVHYLLTFAPSRVQMLEVGEYGEAG